MQGINEKHTQLFCKLLKIVVVNVTIFFFLGARPMSRWLTQFRFRVFVSRVGQRLVEDYRRQMGTVLFRD